MSRRIASVVVTEHERSFCLQFPKGLNEAQWLVNMQDEHCGVDPENSESTLWGASDRSWCTGNYGLKTTPRLEWNWTKNREWNGERVDETMGGYEKEGWSFTTQENTALRRKAVSIETLNAEAPKLICAMLRELAQAYGGAFTDHDGDGTMTEKDMLTEDDIRHLYDSARVNMAELLGLRLYTGQCSNLTLESTRNLPGTRLAAGSLVYECRIGPLGVALLLPPPKNSSLVKVTGAMGAPYREHWHRLFVPSIAFFGLLC